MLTLVFPLVHGIQLLVSYGTKREPFLQLSSGNMVKIVRYSVLDLSVASKC